MKNDEQKTKRERRDDEKKREIDEEWGRDDVTRFASVQ
jgi:hypothetical protein